MTPHGRFIAETVLLVVMAVERAFTISATACSTSCSATRKSPSLSGVVRRLWRRLRFGHAGGGTLLFCVEVNFLASVLLLMNVFIRPTRHCYSMERKHGLA